MTSRQRRTQFAALLFAALLAVAALAACAPAISLVRSEFSIPMSRGEDVPDAERLIVEVRSLLEQIDVGALSVQSDRALSVEAEHAFPLQVVDEGGAERTLRLLSEDAPTNFSYVGDMPVWTVDVHPAFPIDLTARTGAGNINLNLGRFDVTAVHVETTGGDARAVLPDTGASYPVIMRSTQGTLSLVLMTHSTVEMVVTNDAGASRLNLATASTGNGVITSVSGAIELSAAAQVAGELRLRTASGSILIDVSDSAPALRVEVRQVGAGSISMPPFMNFQGGPDNDGPQGIWESADYAAAPLRLSLIVETESGAITIR